LPHTSSVNVNFLQQEFFMSSHRFQLSETEAENLFHYMLCTY
jgi:hypothetical protein